ncbi:MAG: hypothetical protein COA79_22515 [Planctomycetota bacterium]|nr:MAG: hypothetical protein COA79_22515 [Planctomycetota bacterium]
MQKSLIVKYDLATGIKKHAQAQDDALDELNTYLNDGWEVKFAYPMAGHEHSMVTVSLVVIEAKD